jgi:hypothetical protein
MGLINYNHRSVSWHNNHTSCQQTGMNQHLIHGAKREK